MPASGPHAGLGIFTDLGIDAFDHIAPTADMRDKRPVRPSDVLSDLGGQQRNETTALHLGLHGRRGRGAGEFENRGGEVDMRREGLDVHGLEASGQAPEGDCSDAAHVGGTLGRPHAGIKDLHSRRAAIVVHENDQGILRDSEGLKFRQDLADVLVDVVQHAEEVLGVLAESFALVKGRILGAGVIRSVRRVGRDVGVEGSLGRGFAFDPLRGLGEELIGAIASSLHELTVMEDRRAVIGVTRNVAAAARIALADAAGAMDEDFVEATLIRLIFGFVAEVPLAKDAGAITGLLELLGQRGGAQGHPLTFQDGVGDAVLELVTTGEQGAARRGAGRRDLEIGETDALRPELIQVRGLEDRVPVGADVAVTLVIGQDEQDIGPVGGRGDGDEQREQERGEAHWG